MAWKRPDRRRVRAIRDRLREMYGRPINEPHGEPIAELVKTVLSQHTNDRNRDRSFAALRERFPSWEEVRDAPVDQVEDAIRPGGLGRQKAPRIQAILERLGEPPDLDWTEGGEPRGVARLPARPARRRAQNGRLRPDLHLGHPRDPGRRPHPPRRGAPGAVPGEGLLRARARRDAGDRRPRGRLRAAYEPDPPRAPGVPSQTPLRGVRAAPDVPLVPCPAQMSLERAK